MVNNKLLPCKCGADARIRYKDPYVWCECKKKCGMSSGYIFIFLSTEIDEAKKFAVKQWNDKVTKSF